MGYSVQWLTSGSEMPRLRVLAHRLSSPEDYDAENVRAQLGLHRLLDSADFLNVASDYLSSVSQFAELPAEMVARLGLVAALLDSIAEGVQGSVLAAVDARALREYASRQSAALRPGHHIGERFLWESAAQALLGSGHRAANLVLRMGLLDANLGQAPRRLRKAVTTIRRDEPPFSDERAAWVSEGTGQTLASWLHGSDHDGVRELGTALRKWTTNAEWRLLVDLRGREHHRWRPATETDHRESDNRDTVDDVATATLDAMHCLPAAIETFDAAIHSALGDVTGDRIGPRTFPISTVDTGAWRTPLDPSD